MMVWISRSPLCNGPHTSIVKSAPGYLHGWKETKVQTIRNGRLCSRVIFPLAVGGL